MVTALALLFEKIHFLNQLKYVIELSKHFRIEHPIIGQISDFSIKPADPNIEYDVEDPLGGLSPGQRRTVQTYLVLSDQFFMRNALLFPKVFHCSLLPKGEVLSAELVKQVKKPSDRK
jgi:hypothetical protein